MDLNWMKSGLYKLNWKQKYGKILLIIEIKINLKKVKIFQLIFISIEI